MPEYQPFLFGDLPILLDPQAPSRRVPRAVMANRFKTELDDPDYFPTHPWATRGFLQRVLIDRLGINIRAMDAWEPACGEGDMARPMAEYFRDVYATDLYDYSDKPRGRWRDPNYDGQARLLNFLKPEDYSPHITKRGEPCVDFVVCNPPFKLAVQFIQRALAVSRVGVAMLLRVAFLETGGRYENLYTRCPPSYVAISVERISMYKGRLVRRAEKKKNSSTATCYAWFLWLKEPDGENTIWRDEPGVLWVPPVKKRYLRETDYEGGRP